MNDEKEICLPTIPEFFTKQHVLVTGATGFMGKILVEKILRCCPNVEKVYILVRTKKGIGPIERWNRIINLEAFRKLRNENIKQLEKVVVLEGDATMCNLGLSSKNYKLLVENVTVIFHAAATVLFFDNLHQAMKINLKGTLEMAKLAKSIKNLTCFCHVSTAFSNCDRYTKIEEKMYEPIQEWRDLLHALETNTEYDLCCLTSKILSGHPTPYTLTKSLAEQVMAEYSKYYPVVILRPSVVVNAFREPLEGWVEKLHGPSVIGVLISSGILRVQCMKPDESLDYIAVDYAINGFLAAAWEMGTRKTSSGLEVYGCCFGNSLRTSCSEYEKYGLGVTEINPMENLLWYPFLISVTNPFLYQTLFFLLQILPAIIGDIILFCLRKKPILMKITIKIALATQVYKYFMVNFFQFENESYFGLQKKLTPEDKKVFYLIPEGISEKESVVICALGVKKFIFHEKDDTLTQRRKHYWRMYWVDRITRGMLIFMVTWYLIKIIYQMAALGFE